MKENDYRDTRREYTHASLEREDLPNSPFELFHVWLKNAMLSGIDATACTLATASRIGRPAARIVLLKHFDKTGFCWYTDKQSRKGEHLKFNPWAEMVFYWPEQERQVRVYGRVRPLSPEANDEYFNSRPLDSRLSAAASEQSLAIAEKQELFDEIEKIKAEHGDHIPRPDRWGGYRLMPDRIEFWQGQPNRLHDPFQYSKQGSGWRIDRLNP